MRQRALDGIFNPAAAGDLHTHDRDAFDVVFTQDAGELFAIIAFIEFGTADQRNAPADKLLVERAVGIGCAVGGDEQARAVKIRRVDGYQLNLYRPLRQLALHFRRLRGRRGRMFGAHDALRLAAGAAARERPAGLLLWALAAMTAAWS